MGQPSSVLEAGALPISVSHHISPKWTEVEMKKGTYRLVDQHTQQHRHDQASPEYLITEGLMHLTTLRVSGLVWWLSG